MKPLDLFRPKWKHSDPDVRMTAVEKLTNFEKLAYVVKNDKDNDVRDKAINKIFESENGDDLIFLHNLGLVRAKGVGQSIVELKANIENLIDKSIDVVIKPGTYFVSKGDYQNMVTRNEYSFTLYSLEKKTVSVASTCINAGLPIPTENDFFYGVNRVSDDLVSFLNRARNDEIGPMATQAGTWAITDNLSKLEIASRLYSTDRYTGKKTPAISGKDIEAAMIILWQLGIHTLLWEDKTSDGKNAKYFKKIREEEALSKKKQAAAEAHVRMKKVEVEVLARKWDAEVVALSAEDRQKLIDWASIPAGTFIMGSPENEIDRNADEIQHEVTLSTFKMSKYPVTFSQYDAFCSATSREKPDDDGWGRGIRPVINVSWEDATAFAEWMGCRLPTEAEWEYACRAGTTTPFNTGNTLTTYQANYNGNNPYNHKAKGENGGQTMPVCSFAPNKWGLYDMHGNVCEWCSDWYDDFQVSPKINPTGPESGSVRVRRGGYWLDEAMACRSACRGDSYPDYSIIGFRLVSREKVIERNHVHR